MVGNLSLDGCSGTTPLRLGRRCSRPGGSGVHRGISSSQQLGQGQGVGHIEQERFMVCFYLLAGEVPAAMVSRLDPSSIEGGTSPCCPQPREYSSTARHRLESVATSAVQAIVHYAKTKKISAFGKGSTHIAAPSSIFSLKELGC